jgi:hypothetical protein
MVSCDVANSAEFLASLNGEQHPSLDAFWFVEHVDLFHFDQFWHDLEKSTVQCCFKAFLRRATMINKYHKRSGRKRTSLFSELIYIKDMFYI